MVVIARELAVSGLRMVAAVENVVISASKWGKIKTFVQMFTLAALIITPRLFKLGVDAGGHHITWYFVMVMLVLTVVSGIDYFVKARQSLRGRGGSRRPARSEACGRESGDEEARGEWTSRRRTTTAVRRGAAARRSCLASCARRSGCCRRLPGLRLMREEQLHVTLAFIGEVGRARRRGGAGRWSSRCPPSMGGERRSSSGSSCCRRPERARVVALELSDDDGVFARLFEEVMGGLERGRRHAAGEAAVPAAPHDGQAADAGPGATKV